MGPHFKCSFGIWIYEKIFPIFHVCGLLMNQGGENCIAGFFVSTIVLVNPYEWWLNVIIPVLLQCHGLAQPASVHVAAEGQLRKFKMLMCHGKTCFHSCCASCYHRSADVHEMLSMRLILFSSSYIRVSTLSIIIYFHINIGFVILSRFSNVVSSI